MDKGEHFEQIGFEKGFEDAKKTGANISQENIDRYLNAETRKLSITHSREFIKGWYKGFNEGALDAVCKRATNDDFWKNHIFWENPIYKSR